MCGMYITTLYCQFSLINRLCQCNGVDALQNTPVTTHSRVPIPHWYITYMYIRGVSTFNSPLLLQCQRGPHFEPSLIVKYIHRGGSHSTHPQWCNTYIGKWRGPLDRFTIYIGEAPTFNRPYNRYSRGTRLSTQRVLYI